MLLRKFGFLMMAVSMFACAAETDDEVQDETDSELSALKAGVNSAACKRSPYNCGLHPGHGQRVQNAAGGEDWAVDASYAKANGGVPVVDGNGNSMGKSKKTEFTLNYGQTRRLKGVTYVMALSAGVGSAGWVPIDAFRSKDSLRAHVGEVNAHGSALKEMGCYAVSKTFDADLNKYKVVKGATDKDAKEPDDYLPQKRSNGAVYANLAFSVPGDDLGAPAVDIFPAGTKFRRLDVTTWDGGAPSLDVKLYSKPSGSTKYTTLSNRRMKFIYGYIMSAEGIRYGWMPLDGLDESSGCPAR